MFKTCRVFLMLITLSYDNLNTILTFRIAKKEIKIIFLDKMLTHFGFRYFRIYNIFSNLLYKNVLVISNISLLT